MRAGGNRSNPASTGVWVVKRLPARVTARATSKGLAVVLHEAPRAFQHGEGGMPFVEVADLRLQPEGRSRRQPPMPSTISWSSRSSGPPP